MVFIGRPNPEQAPAYAKYYLDRTQGQENLIESLEKNKQDVLDFIATIPADKEDFQYADDKWTIKGVLLHTIEAERVFQYRALRFSRKDSTPLPGFEESWYAQNNNSEMRTMKDLAAEFESVRNASIHLFEHMTLSMIDFEGPANSSVVTPRSLGWMIVGHTIHHCDIIKERYLVEVDEQY